MVPPEAASLGRQGRESSALKRHLVCSSSSLSSQPDISRFMSSLHMDPTDPVYGIIKTWQVLRCMSSPDNVWNSAAHLEVSFIPIQDLHEAAQVADIVLEAFHSIEACEGVCKEAVICIRGHVPCTPPPLSLLAASIRAVGNQQQ